MSMPGLVLMMAGGTGGHVFPGLATAECLREKGCDVKWLGTRKGIESRLVPDADIELFYLNVSGIRGKGFKRLLTAPVQLILALLQSIRILRRIKPNCVLGMGGFVSGPGGLAAWILGIPLIIHEQNAVAGTTNRLLSRLASRVFESFPNTFPRIKDVVRTGNPIRASICRLPDTTQDNCTADDSKPLKLLVLGGSLGAKAINDLVPTVLRMIRDTAEAGAGQIEVWHQAGEAHVNNVIEDYRAKEIDARVDAFIDDMCEAYCWADLIVCRSGALTVSEIAAVGRASILVPFPFAIDDHQTRNAEWLANAGAAVLVPQADFSVKRLQRILADFLSDRKVLQTMASRAKKLAYPNAAEEMAAACMEYIHV